MQDDGSGGSESQGERPFHLWPDQHRIISLMASERLLIILKARQLGISWVACAYALHLCLFQRRRVVLIISKGKLEAQEMVRRISVLYKRLPEWLRDRLPALTTDNTARLEWGNDSTVQALAATPDAGSSLTASLLILDEFAKMLFAKGIYAAAKPTIDGGGKLFVISTAKGKGNPFYDLWVKTEELASGFVGLFLPWWSRPGRDAKWYQEKMAESTDPTDVLQDYPATPKEAFKASGTPRFLDDWIEYQLENHVCDPLIDSRLQPELVPYELQGIPGLQIYYLPGPDFTYIIGEDSAEGLPHSDPTAATVLCCETWEEVAIIHGKIDAVTIAYYVDKLGRFYNDAWVNVARRNHGGTTIAQLVDLGYPNLVRGPDSTDSTPRYGWDENVKTKPMMVDATAEALRDHLLIIHSKKTVDELGLYEVKDNGTTGAPEGRHEDRVITILMCVAFLARPKPSFHGALTAPRDSTAGALPSRPGHGVGVRSHRLEIGGWRPQTPTPLRSRLRGF